MATTTQSGAAMKAAREQLLKAVERETATTARVLRAYPEAESELRPHPKAKNARELAWLFAMEQMLSGAAVRGEMDLSKGMPPAPESMKEIVSKFEESRKSLIELLRSCSDDQLQGTVRFFTGPKQMGDVPMIDFLWFLVNDQIHHRGQFSVYLRMSGGKVPSIYGPSADEPWN